MRVRIPNLDGGGGTRLVCIANAPDGDEVHTNGPPLSAPARADVKTQLGK